MDSSMIPEIVDCPSRVLSMIQQDGDIIKLLVDDPDVNTETIDLIGKQLFDYDYVSDGITEEVLSYICVDTDIRINARDPKIKDVDLFIYIICHKDNITIDSRKFPTLKGNRRDNLVVKIENLLSENRDLGVGKLRLSYIDRFRVSDKYLGKVMVYEIPSIQKRIR